MNSPAHYYLKGDDNHWRACCLLYHDYTRRKEQAYHAFQLEMAIRRKPVSIPHLRFMMGAYLTYLDLCQAVGTRPVAKLRRALPYTYFARAGQKWRMHDLTAQDVIYQLELVVNGETQNSTQLADGLVAEAYVNGDTGGEPNGRKWLRVDLFPPLARFVEMPPPEMPESILYHAREFVRLSRDWLEGEY